MKVSFENSWAPHPQFKPRTVSAAGGHSTTVVPLDHLAALSWSKGVLKGSAIHVLPLNNMMIVTRQIKITHFSIHTTHIKKAEKYKGFSSELSFPKYLE